MAGCATLQEVSCTFSQASQVCGAKETRTATAHLTHIRARQLSKNQVGSAPAVRRISHVGSPFSHVGTQKRSAHITMSTSRPTTRRQRRKVEQPQPNPVDDDPPENWKKEDYDDGLERPWLEKPGFWEGERWNLLGTFVQWMPLIGVVFAAVASGIAVVSYNGGATDYKETAEFQAAVQNQKELDELSADSIEAPSVSNE